MKAENVYRNPVPFTDEKRHTNPDPFILRWCGEYYCYATDEHGVLVSKSEDLAHWTYLGYALKDPDYKDFWAPSVIYLNGTFYMYYSNIPVDETNNHEEHLKVAVSDRPDGEFEYQKTFFDHFSIDSHPVKWKNKLYMFYSVNNWMGKETYRPGTCILLDEMKNPFEFCGHPKPVILPSLPEEIYEKNRDGDGRDWYTIEGAAPILDGDRFWLLYSANAYIHEDYFIGETVANVQDDLNSMEFRKYPASDVWYPLLKKNQYAEGTGHNTCTLAPNLMDHWIVYHGRRADEELIVGTEQREMYIDRLLADGDRLYIDNPSASGKVSPRQPDINLRNAELSGRTEQFFGNAPEDYVMETWIEGKRCHADQKFSIYLAYQDDRNHLDLEINTGRKTIRLLQVCEGIQLEVADADLPDCFKETVPHLYTVRRSGRHFRISVDETELLNADADACEGKTGICTWYSDIAVKSFALTDAAYLCGKDLIRMSRWFKASEAYCSDDGLYNPYEDITIKAGKSLENRDYEILLEPCGLNSCAVIEAGNQEEKRILEYQGRFTVRGSGTDFQMTVKNCRIVSLKVTKI